jgi:ribosomal 50S subunit-recycling heat shock protein
MRLDKFLKVSRIIKRRQVADEACSSGRVSVNGRVVKSSYQVKEGDVVEISYAQSKQRVRIRSVAEHALKADAPSMYEIVE